MRIQHIVTLASALLLTAGCAHEERHAGYDEGISPYAADGTKRYTGQSNNISLDANGQSSRPMVVAVVSGDTVVKLPEVSDDTLVSQVREALERNAEIAPIVPNIQITAKHGVMTLSGNVQSQAQKRQIETICLDASGVSLVVLDNQLMAPVENAPASNGSLNPTSNGEDNNVNRAYSAGDTNNIQNTGQSTQDQNQNTKSQTPR